MDKDDFSETTNVNTDFNKQITDNFRGLSRSNTGRIVIKDAFFARDSTDEIFFQLIADGSDHSELAFRFLTNRYLSDEQFKLLVTYVYSLEMDYLYNFNNKKETVIEKFETLIGTNLTDNKCLFDKANKQIGTHPLNQQVLIGETYKTNYLVCGLNGLRGPRGSNLELKRNLHFIMSEKVPSTILIKQKISERGRLNWLFVFDKMNEKAFDMFHAFQPLIRENDFVKGLTMIPDFLSNDNVKIQFEHFAEKLGYDWKYQCETYKNLGKQLEFVVNEVNFSEVNYDFVVLFNNTKKYRLKSDRADWFDLVKRLGANVCFFNFQ